MTDTVELDPALREAVLEPELLTADLPGIGGVMRARPDDFSVEEIPAYPPDGQANSWLLLQLAKRGMSTEDAVRALARALDIGIGDIGFAGRKDRDAVSRQWVSVPARFADRLPALELPGIELGPAHPHSHKLRTGHLRGNRFDLVIRDLACTYDVAAARTEAKLARVRATGGLANAFGPQRFGEAGRTLDRGIAAMFAGRGGARGNMIVAAGQAALFNLYLDARVRNGLLRRSLVGDILKKTETGGLFTCTDTAADDERLAAGELVVTGPLFGSRMMSPPEGSPSFELEHDVLDALGIRAEALRSLGRAALGTRRPLQVAIEDPQLSPALAATAEDGSTLLPGLRIVFTLPAGCFATTLCRELQQGALQSRS